MSEYRKKPVVIEARQAKSYLDFPGLTAWVRQGGGDASYGQIDPGPAFMEIHTPEGRMRVDVLDWVICGVKGEFYPCKPDIFAETYEPA